MYIYCAVNEIMQLLKLQKKNMLHVSQLYKFKCKYLTIYDSFVIKLEIKKSYDNNDDDINNNNSKYKYTGSCLYFNTAIVESIYGE